MPRTKKNSKIRLEMCRRFVVAMGELGLTPAETARALGYSTQATISKVQRGEAFVDVERLHLLATLRSPRGKAIDLNWLISGHRSKDCDL